MEINLVKLIGEAKTLKEAFWNLQGTELMIGYNFGSSSYKVLETRDEFAILEDLDPSKKQYLHPYGSSIGYYVYSIFEEERARIILI